MPELATAETVETVIIDNYICDAETGEILGVVDAPAEFVVNDEDSCAWVMRKMLEAEADVAAIDTAADVLLAEAILRNAAKMRTEKQRRVDWLHARFDAELGEYARKELEGKKTKTLKTLLGSISFRKISGKLKVRDAAKATEWARFYCPEAVKVTESFLISALPDDTAAEIVTNLAPDKLDVDTAVIQQAFLWEPERETVKIETGVGK